MFWIAACIEQVSDTQVRWPATYFQLKNMSSNGDDEYSKCRSNEVIWRDVVLADITNMVRVQGKKIVIPYDLKCLLSDHLTSSNSASTSVPSPQNQPLPDMIDSKSLAKLMSLTSVARRVVSVGICWILPHL